MRIAHLADVHLDFRAYQRTDARGWNQRQVDAHAAFTRAVDQVLAAHPDVVLIAGDIWHRPLVYSESLQFGFRQVRRLTAAGLPVVVISGNHSTPKQRDMGCPVSLLEEAGALVVIREARTIRIGELAIGCLPSAALTAGDWPARDPDAGFNVLLAHGGFAGIWPYVARPDGNIPAERFAGWDYVALGDYHVAHQVAPNAWYSGALDYVTTNPWAELQAETALGRPGVKGWLLATLEPGQPPQVELQAVPLARRVLELPAIDAAGLEPDVVSAQLAAQAADVEGQIVKQPLVNVTKSMNAGLDYALIRRLKSQALQYHLAIQKAEEAIAVDNVLLDGTGRRRPLAEIVANKLATMELPPDLDRERLITMGAGYLERANQAAETEAETGQGAAA